MHPEGKQQMWNDVVGPVGQPMMSLDLQILGGIESSCPYLTNLCETRNATQEVVQSPPIFTIKIKRQMTVIYVFDF